ITGPSVHTRVPGRQRCLPNGLEQAADRGAVPRIGGTGGERKGLGPGVCPGPALMIRPQSAGPVARVTVAVWGWPGGAGQPIGTWSRGWCGATAAWGSDCADTAGPSIESITSPADRPAWAAGDPERVPSTVSALPLWPPPEKPPLAEEFGLASCTPR